MDVARSGGRNQHRSARSDTAKLPWFENGAVWRTSMRVERTPSCALRRQRGCYQRIELDYDAGKMTFDAAMMAMEGCADPLLLYTSASYVAGSKEKWRVMAPLSEEYVADKTRGIRRGP